ncbi:hypothetical protein GLOIN_2v1692587 [Rhizophagus irregularis DAOM 181602=DAOM 197198]|uniref:SRP54-type proteins GTP-binding domain-containing protein n=1 Tax=Rhizophagus irregularis (strain DAOM 181602 / DAOM 197198 / MUCL 43194) TaxID=747089 RepID=A0A2P4PBP2_RHIID|nr:hypothetical protein GLOIN_2v1692587 [Rhizophagus irregularis DAOM 181602=DAOM 197198]POG62785.1 hypothetical protein GLOIN_2v1692587 [Rhizophagus irregularis DAOM 181602=DAOM 197198]|eukprot:XP_025169651.1 hypothetical protein GLOIN_2v1692587 [Rhizophagus irregularis DAOM 181602=DAOM 197198]
MIVKKNDSFYYGPGEDYPKKEVAKRAAIREMARRPNLVSSNFIWEIPIKDFLTASDEVQRSCLMFKPNQVIFKSVQGRFRVILSKILGVNPTNSQISAASWLVGAWFGGGIVKSPIIYVRLPLLAGILDISSHLLEENRNTDMVYSTNIVANMKECSDNITTPSCCTIIKSIQKSKFNRDMVWRFKVEKVGLGSYYGFKVDKNERILLADLTVSHNVLIAACDTFRSGAVEQLRVHVRNLNALGQNSNVELYERGYRKDAARIAKDAINYGIIAVDQLTKFNQALKDFSGLQDPRHIDGMILTKFDTVDDKVWRK